MLPTAAMVVALAVMVVVQVACAAEARAALTVLLVRCVMVENEGASRVDKDGVEVI